MAKKKKPLSKRAVAKKHGFKSGLEDSVNDQLKKSKKEYDYEAEKLHYVQPAVNRTYLPDFKLTKKNGEILYIETKGLWKREDRLRFDWIFEQHNPIDIRFVFQNPNAKLYKGSKTTYAEYCDKRGWKWAKGEIPYEWLSECK